MFVRYLNQAPYQNAGWYICSFGNVEGQRTPCLNVLDGDFPTEAEAIAFMHNNNEALQQAHMEMEACCPSLQELNDQLVGRTLNGYTRSAS